MGRAKTGFPVIDLFAGAGGLSIGSRLAEGDVRLAVEFDAACCKTLALNQHWHNAVVSADVCNISGADLRSWAKISSGEPLLLVGGAPCQPFSKAAFWLEDGDEARFRRARADGRVVARPAAALSSRPDKRKDLIFEFLRLVDEARADCFVFENVPAIRFPRNRPHYDAFKAAARDHGYHLTEAIANAAEYGVAQTRERVFILGARRRAPRVPQSTHCAIKTGSLFYRPAVAAAEAIERFSGPEYAEPEEVVTGRWAQHLHEVPPGGNYKAHTAWGGHSSPTFQTETRFWNFLLKLAPDRPAWTIPASPGPWTGPFHWSSRRLRTVEIAALQGFPDGYLLAGSRRSRIKQLGNAVPPPLGCAMIRSAIEAAS
jgi:DNA (cytosine-5)-methyltransferase 1